MRSLLLSLCLCLCASISLLAQKKVTPVKPKAPAAPQAIFRPEKMAAPKAKQIPKSLTAVNGDVRQDPYYWLNQRDSPEVIRYLEAENKYANEILRPVARLKEKIYKELVARIQQDDNSVPYGKDGYWYYSRVAAGQEYSIYCRKKGAMTAPEEIMLDLNAIAKGRPYCSLGGSQVSPDGRYLAYAVDFTGRGLYTAYIKDLEKNRLLPDTFSSAFGSLIWAKDSKSIFYDTKDPVTLRTNKVWRHTLGTNPARDELKFEGKDETLYVSISSSKSEDYVFVNQGYTQNVETWYLDNSRPESAFALIKKQAPDFYYTVEQYKDRFLITTNWQSSNFRVMQAPIANPAFEQWTDLIAPDARVLIQYISVFADYIAVNQYKDGLAQIRVIHMPDRQEHLIDLGEPTYAANIQELPEFNTGTLRYVFSSPRTPATTIDYDMETRKKEVRKVTAVLGGFKADDYETEFAWVTARDGAKVPMSIVYKKGTPRDGSAPFYLEGYGSYGYIYTPNFSRDKISLLDRGFICGIAHIRGGMENGFSWYEDGKMMQKLNTFNDFIDCSQWLVDEKYTSKDRLFAQGRSAGGLLMGAIANMRPDLYKGIIAGVPFVDVLTTMSDPSIPLTTGEYTEWGNPAIAAQYEYMKKYSPYDNVQAKAYPNIFVTTSYSDSQVQYFEPAKWVARLRATKTDRNLLLFKTNMTGSHGGASGRFASLEERAELYAWMLGLLDREEARSAH